MAQDWPDVFEIVKTVREFIDDVAPQLHGLDRYHALCTIYLLEILERELRTWQSPVTVEDERLRALAEAAPTDSPATVAAALSRRIRDGDFDRRMGELLEVLTAHVVAKVKVSKPAVLDPVHRDG